ncbi:MAG TPA: dihydroorotate dehydrogenase [bacterium]|nr:dihydroorotate dehydrogenase [bacterium]
MAPDLTTRLGPLTLATPLVAASGCYGYGTEYADLVRLDEFGAVVSKGISPEPRTGNPIPRLAETSGHGLLNSIGLQNPGIDGFLEDKWPQIAASKVPVLINVIGYTIADYVTVVERLEHLPVAGWELNVSCPNVDKGGIEIGAECTSVGEVTARCVAATSKPVIVKLSPNQGDPRPFAEVALEAGAVALTIANTYLGMSVDIHRRTSRLGRDYGGLSGPGVKPITLRMVHQVYQSLGCPIIASGGIYKWEDAAEYLIVGATALALGTVNFVDPFRVAAIKAGLSDYLDRLGLSLDELRGSYRSPAVAQVALEQGLMSPAE